MADAGKADPQQPELSPEHSQAEPQPQWVCRNCGTINEPGVLHCDQCGFGRDYDPDTAPAVDFSEVQATLERDTKLKRQRLTLFLELAKAAMLLVIMVAVLSVALRLLGSWPFQGAFERDAETLANVVLSVQSYVDTGVTKGRYDELIVPLSVEKTRFRIKYGERPERQREAFQKLMQAAEYYEIARAAWEHELKTADALERANPNAVSTDASESVKKYWTTASSNALRALEDLR